MPDPNDTWILQLLLLPSPALASPLLMAYVVGIAITLYYRRVAPRACNLAVFAFSLMLLSPVACWGVVFLVADAWAPWGFYVLFGLNTIVNFVAVVLLAIAVISGRTPARSRPPTVDWAERTEILPAGEPPNAMQPRS